MDINNVCISGHLTRDAQRKQLPSGSSVLEFSVAVNESRKNKQTGNYEDYPNYVDCSLFGSRAEKLALYLTKGKGITISGRLRYSEWMKDDERRTKLSVIVNDVVFMGSGGKDANVAQGAQNQQGQAGVQRAQAQQGMQSQAQGQYQQAGYAQTQQAPVQQQQQLFNTPAPQPQYRNAQYDGVYGDEIPF